VIRSPCHNNDDCVSGFRIGRNRNHTKHESNIISTLRWCVLRHICNVSSHNTRVHEPRPPTTHCRTHGSQPQVMCSNCTPHITSRLHLDPILIDVSNSTSCGPPSNFDYACMNYACSPQAHGRVTCNPNLTTVRPQPHHVINDEASCWSEGLMHTYVMCGVVDIHNSGGKLW